MIAIRPWLRPSLLAYGKAALVAALWLTTCSPPPPEPESPSGSVPAGRSDIQAFTDITERGSSRLSWMSTTTPPATLGQVFVDYGRPRWKSEYEDSFDELTKGKRWRFGNNAWSILDTNVPLSLSGRQVAPGQYYLVIERSSEGQWYLVLLDPRPIREKKLDPFFADEAPPGLRAPLEWTRTGEPTEKLRVRLVPVEGNARRAKLEIRWGEHQLLADMELGS